MIIIIITNIIIILLIPILNTNKRLLADELAVGAAVDLERDVPGDVGVDAVALLGDVLELISRLKPWPLVTLSAYLIILMILTMMLLIRIIQ